MAREAPAKSIDQDPGKDGDNGDDTESSQGPTAAPT